MIVGISKISRKHTKRSQVYFINCLLNSNVEKINFNITKLPFLRVTE